MSRRSISYGSGSGVVKMPEIGSVVGQGSQKLLLLSNCFAVAALTRSTWVSVNMSCPRRLCLVEIAAELPIQTLGPTRPVKSFRAISASPMSNV